jgi:hypothetical protein
MKTRKEERCYIQTSKLGEFIRGIKPITTEKEFKTGYNQTLYLNNSEHEVPFGISIKARKYSKLSWGKKIKLNLNDEWILELKKDLIIEDSRLRQKERKNLKLKDISKILQKETKDFSLSLPLRPCVADSYRRRHYLVKGSDDFRITIDDNLNYYFFESGLIGIKIGQEDYIRIEVKVPPNKLKSSKFKMIRNLLLKLKAEPIISKKDTAYALLGKYLRNKFNEKTAKSDIEIEAKLSLDGRKQNIFHKIRNDFKRGRINGFGPMKGFPYILESGRLHKYIVNHQNNYIRIGLKGDSQTTTLKENSETIKDLLNLNCILKRREIKISQPKKDLNQSLRMLYRKRKYFIVQNNKNKETYCILIDRCTCGAKELFQIEIEGLTLSSLRDKEAEIIKDIAYITNKILRKYKDLKPTTQTKLDWLKSLKLKSNDWYNLAVG